MNGHPEPSAFRGDVAEEKILERLVFGLAERAPLRVNAVGDSAVHLFECQRPQIRRFELFRHRSALPVALQGRGYDAAEILREGRRRGSQSRGLQVAAPQFVFEGEKRLAVGVALGEFRRVERVHERVGIRNPAETRRLDARAHFDAVREHRLDAHLVEHPGRILPGLCP